MALELVQPGPNPMGQIDGHDDIYLTVRGGEVATIIGVTLGTDNAAADVDDGYVGTTRMVATTALTSGDRPLMLVDEGISGYGTLFGSVVGGITGQLNTGQQLGPHTATGSGKLTLWHQPGTYAVTLDAVDTTHPTGLVPTNGTLSISDPLYATATGLLTPNAVAAFEVVVLGRFLNFEPAKGGSFVTTPVSLVSAANSPVGQGQPQAQTFARALFTFMPPA